MTNSEVLLLKLVLTVGRAQSSGSAVEFCSLLELLFSCSSELC
jgi:hypothetical protein